MKSLKQFIKEQSKVTFSKEEMQTALDYAKLKGYEVESDDPIKLSKIEKFIYHIAFLQKRNKPIDLRDLYKKHF
jgi:hypothetical protein